jgi:predicted deacylase
VSRAADGKSMALAIELEQAFAWLAGGELLTDAWYAQWLRELEAMDGIEVARIGASVQGRPIFLAASEGRPEVILLLGRQHPPEVTGALAMRPFVTTLLADTPLAKAFRARYQLLMVPLVNPDGVALGYWRHNEGGTDLNRDWGPFTQPESRAIRDRLQSELAGGRRLRLMLDFHATGKNVFYTQSDEVSSDPPGFTARWLAASQTRLPEYAFEREASVDTVQANSKNWFHQAYGIPAITYETGDETDRDTLAAAAVVFAEEMMRTMLEAPR